MSEITPADIPSTELTARIYNSDYLPLDDKAKHLFLCGIYMNDVSIEAFAEATARSVNTIKSRLSVARQQLGAHTAGQAYWQILDNLSNYEMSPQAINRDLGRIHPANRHALCLSANGVAAVDGTMRTGSVNAYAASIERGRETVRSHLAKTYQAVASGDEGFYSLAPTYFELRRRNVLPKLGRGVTRQGKFILVASNK